MCGIVGVVNGKSVTRQILSGLKNLEYRGYDSAGLAIHHGRGIWRRRVKGGIRNLERAMSVFSKEGAAGIGHTRWATHGEPTRRNAHPHTGTGIAVVHNGIIENFMDLREKLISRGYAFSSDTDSEVIPHLIASFRDKGLNQIQSTRAAMDQLSGQFAFAVLFDNLPGTVFAARQESPLSVGYNGVETVVASDMLAFSGNTETEMFLENGDLAIIQRNNILVLDKELEAVDRKWIKSRTSVMVNHLDGHDHFMHKEIFEQPAVVQDIAGHDNQWRQLMDQLPKDFLEVKDLSVIACGTSLYAGMSARGWFEKFAGITLNVDFASEFRYRFGSARRGDVGLLISQSGETADTLACLRHFQANNCATIALVNVPTSTMAREADLTIPSRAGPEIGVASTKAFVAQMSTLLRLSIEIGIRKGHINQQTYDRIRTEFEQVPELIRSVLSSEDLFGDVATAFGKATSSIFIGRGDGYPIALEGALKLKEISYIHAEGFAAGELKHGPIALVDDKLPVVVIAPKNGHFAKTCSNAREIAARKGRLIVLSDDDTADGLSKHKNCKIVPLPSVTETQMPFVYVTALQLLSYHVAILKGTNIDKPRNLAKSVTVE